jgi:hypothetical protein
MPGNANRIRKDQGCLPRSLTVAADKIAESRSVSYDVITRPVAHAQAKEYGVFAAPRNCTRTQALGLLLRVRTVGGRRPAPATHWGRAPVNLGASGNSAATFGRQAWIRRRQRVPLYARAPEPKAARDRGLNEVAHS